MVSLQTLVAGVTMGSIYVLVAMGFNLISNTTWIVNFSQGNIIAFGALVYITSSVTARLSLPLSLIITVLVSAILGLVLQSFIIYPMVKRRISIGGIGLSMIAFASFLSNLAQLFGGTLTKGIMGGDFLYTNQESLSLGIVARIESLNLKEPRKEVYKLLDEFKERPEIKNLIRG